MTAATPVQLRREPPRFRRMTVQAVTYLGPRMVRVTFAGPDLEGLAVELPGASVRVLLPSPGTHDLVMPTWNGNEFLLPDGSRPAIRTFTPRRADPGAGELDVDIVLHGSGVASEWAARAGGGDEAAVSGPGRGYVVDGDAEAFLLAGDESAIPAMSQLLEAVPDTAAVRVHVEISDTDGRVELPSHPRATVEWHALPPGAAAGDALVAAVIGSDLAADTRVWVAGEAAAVHRIRRHLFEERGWPRRLATVRGYWKHGRGGDEEDGE